MKLMTLSPYSAARSDVILLGMDEPTGIAGDAFEAYLYQGYTIQCSEEVGYEGRWFVYRQRRPFRAWLKYMDGTLHTFGSLKEAIAWWGQNPDALPVL